MSHFSSDNVQEMRALAAQLIEWGAAPDDAYRAALCAVYRLSGDGIKFSIPPKE